MAWFADLGTTCYPTVPSADYIRAVGWLSAEQPFTMGKVAQEFVACHLSSTERLHGHTAFTADSRANALRNRGKKVSDGTQDAIGAPEPSRTVSGERER